MEKIQRKLSFEEKSLLESQIKKARELKDRSFSLNRGLCEEQLSKVEGVDDDVRDAAKAFLLASAQLAGQIIESLSNGYLLISLIGLRALYEYCINSAYVFSHPEHGKDMNWMKGQCQDLLERTNDAKAMKHELGDCSLKERVEKVGLGEKHKQAYPFFCDFSHMTHHVININDQRLFKKYTFLALQECLCYSQDIREHICDGLNLKKDKAFENDLVLFKEECIGYAF